MKKEEQKIDWIEIGFLKIQGMSPSIVTPCKVVIISN